MNPYTRAVLFVLRLIAFGCIVCSLLLLGLYFVSQKADQPSEGMLSLVLKTLPLLFGVGLLIKSHAIARKLTEDFDD